ncbi:hypothetical protein BDV96DRAFT_650684 [Lophiotrema nucula]|uniref:Uncharacterized protein n=1 Tax=Lophiotrema nucula TaxID=690887 RepID=A0A6A5YTP9_9PLEO|nr:hypothetical protein BDV96DRAFT_650684 [Lophiotrema nucula]
MAEKLGRKVKSVAERLRYMRAQYRVSTSKDEESRNWHDELDDNEHAVLEERFYRILQELREGNITNSWKCVLTSISTRDWAAKLLPLIPIRVKHMLASPRQPTVSELKALEWKDTSSMGVYFWILQKLHNPMSEESHIYVGSATKYGWELAGRQLQHERHEAGPKLPRRVYNLKTRKRRNWTGNFHTLPVVDRISDESQEVMQIRRLVIVAEVILTTWLGGFWVDRGEQQRLHSLCPWHPITGNYCGLCSHSPLSLDYPTLAEQAKSGDCD